MDPWVQGCTLVEGLDPKSGGIRSSHCGGPTQLSRPRNCGVYRSLCTETACPDDGTARRSCHLWWRISLGKCESGNWCTTPRKTTPDPPSTEDVRRTGVRTYSTTSTERAGTAGVRSGRVRHPSRWRSTSCRSIHVPCDRVRSTEWGHPESK